MFQEGADTTQAAKAITDAAAALSKAAAALANHPALPAGPAMLTPGVIWWFFVAFGFGTSLIAVIFAVKSRFQASSILQAVGGGGISSALLAALGTQVAGVSVRISVTEAIVMSALWFIVGSMVWIGLGVAAFYFGVMRPLGRRFGRAHGARAFVEMINGDGTLAKWVGELLEANQADRVWDEFACAFEDVSTGLAKSQEGFRLSMKTLSALEPPPSGSVVPAIRLLRKQVGPHISELCAQLTRTTLNFTVWRVSKSKDELEHLVSFPVEPGHEAGYGLKTPLPVWKDSSKTRTGSLAAAAMLEKKYTVLIDGRKRRSWPRRKLGVTYDAVGAMPIPCDGITESPWAVICVESRDGTLPVKSNTMREMLGRLASMIADAKPLIAVRTIDETRGPCLPSAASPPDTTTPAPSPPTSTPEPSSEPKAGAGALALADTAAQIVGESGDDASPNGTVTQEESNSQGHD